MLAPIAEAALAGGMGFDQIEPRGAVGHAHDQFGANAFGRRERNERVRVGIIAERGRIGDVDPCAREIDRGVERVAAEREAIAGVGTAGELDHHLADGNDAGLLLGHWSPAAQAALRERRNSPIRSSALTMFSAELAYESRR